MQVSQDTSSNKVGAEDSINFRPSPNFKNMKKFFKMKLDNVENEMKHGNVTTTEPLLQPNIEKCEPKKEVQPPLPLDPPPNDDIEATNTIKTSVDHGISKEEKPVDADLKKPKPKETICRDFLRGTCTRIGCRFAHKSDVSHEDLYGVYTFCHEYQSQMCARAHCRYVHATVFEEQEYYRTRYLPPHAFAHMINKNPINNNNNKNLLMPPPPPPPPKTQVQPKLNKESVNFNVPPPPLHNETAAVDCVASNAMKVVPSTIASLTSLAPLVQSSPKRDWMETFSNPGRGLDAEMQAPKKCKQCNNIEFRYQYNKDKLEKLKQAKEEIHKKIAMLDKNSEKLNTFIQALLIRSVLKKAGVECVSCNLSNLFRNVFRMLRSYRNLQTCMALKTSSCLKWWALWPQYKATGKCNQLVFPATFKTA